MSSIHEGNIGQPFEKATSKNGLAYYKSRIADTFNRRGEKVTVWHNIVLFVPEEKINMLGVGMRIRVKGTQELTAYISKSNEAVPVSTILASEVEIVPKKEPTAAPLQAPAPSVANPANDDDIPF